MQPPRSPRQSQRQNQPTRKQLPYVRPRKLAREESVLSTIKNIFNDPMGWFSNGDSADSHDEQNDVGGKRRRVGEQPPPSGMDNADDDDNHRMKRVRRDSPPPQPQQGYNDPPSTLFLRPASSLPFPLHPISDNPKRRTVSPQASVSNNLYSLGAAPRAQTRPPNNVYNRLVAQDPPRRPQYPFHDPSHIPLPVSREGSVDHSSPGPTSPPSSQSTFSQSQQGRAFHIRHHDALLPTDQSYQSFGPEPKRKSQERTLPGERQTGFVKRPRLEDLQEQGTEPSKPATEGEQEVTLGSLAETKKGVCIIYSSFFSPLSFFSRFPILFVAVRSARASGCAGALVLYHLSTWTSRKLDASMWARWALQTDV